MKVKAKKEQPKKTITVNNLVDGQIAIILKNDDRPHYEGAICMVKENVNGGTKIGFFLNRDGYMTIGNHPYPVTLLEIEGGPIDLTPHFSSSDAKKTMKDFIWKDINEKIIDRALSGYSSLTYRLETKRYNDELLKHFEALGYGFKNGNDYILTICW